MTSFYSGRFLDAKEKLFSWVQAAWVLLAAVFLLHSMLPKVALAARSSGLQETSPPVTLRVGKTLHLPAGRFVGVKVIPSHIARIERHPVHKRVLLRGLVPGLVSLELLPAKEGFAQKLQIQVVAAPKKSLGAGARAKRTSSKASGSDCGSLAPARPSSVRPVTPCVPHTFVLPGWD